ncbi:DeoR/GlpR family DNA-binding transcription regulator [Ornatilinea apprima]|nr:DeoR/GlpR family DNA-binding transcription regulator [Ornatilinea apprima]
MTISKDLYMEERRQNILRLLDLQGKVSVTDLSTVFSVSEVTIRADLQALADSGLLIRTHGGALKADPALVDITLTSRRERKASEKSRIGQAAAQLVQDGDSIFLDSSSTALAIAPHLKNRRNLTVLTNCIAVAQELMDAPEITVVMTGGRLRRDTASLVGGENLDVLARYNIQKGFFGAHGIDFVEGLTDVSADEAEVKRLLVAKCRMVIAVLDASKWGRVGLSSFATFSSVRVIVTDTNAPAELVARARMEGVEVVSV